MELKITPSGQTIVKPAALGPVANTDTKLLIYGLFQKGRVLAQDGVGIHAVKRATRFEALEPIRQGIHQHFGGFQADTADGLQLRHDHGSQFMSGDFQNEIRFLGIESSPAFVREPEGNGLHLVHEHREKLYEEKEEQREIRERMREEQRAEKEIEKASRDAEEEEQRYAKSLDGGTGPIRQSHGCSG